MIAFLEIENVCFLSKRCAGQDDATVRITSPNNAIHEFSLELLAFRYFGSSDAVVIVCEVLICKNDPFASLSEECKRCGQTSNRRRRNEADSKENAIIGRSIVQTPPIYIMERQGKASITLKNQRWFNVLMRVEKGLVSL